MKGLNTREVGNVWAGQVLIKLILLPLLYQQQQYHNCCAMIGANHTSLIYPPIIIIIFQKKRVFISLSTHKSKAFFASNLFSFLKLFRHTLVIDIAAASSNSRRVATDHQCFLVKLLQMGFLNVNTLPFLSIPMTLLSPAFPISGFLIQCFKPTQSCSIFTSPTYSYCPVLYIFTSHDSQLQKC